MAKGNFYTNVIRKAPRYHLPNRNYSLELLEPEFRARIKKFKQFAESQGHKIVVDETYRSHARQVHLFKDLKVASKEVGLRSFGLQADFQLYINGVYDPASYAYKAFADLAKAAGVLFGLHWVHGVSSENGLYRVDSLQGVPDFRRDELFTGTWYPPQGYNVYADLRAHGR